MSFNQWDLKSIGEIGDVITGKTPSTENEKNFGDMCYFITPRDMTGQKKIDFTERKLSPDGIESVKKQFIKGPAICVSCIGSDMGKVVICENDFVTNQQINTISNIKGNYDIDFLYYSLKPMKDYLHGIAGGSTMPIVNKSTFETIKISVPTLNQQKAIAKVLSDLDEKIEINNKINRKLEEMAQAIFKQWFVDFEFPNEYGKPYKSSGGEMIESELGMIPEGWNSKSLLDIADYLNGLAMQKFRPKDDEKGIPVLKIKELRQGKSDENSDLCSLNIDPKYIIHDGDVIFSWSGSLLVDFWCGGKCGLNQHLFKVTSSKFEKWFYYLWTKYHLDKFTRIAKDKATTMGHIKRADLSNSIVLVPNEVIMNKANLILNPIIEKIIEARIEERKLSQLRDTLLPKLMSGEIRVPID